MSLRLLPLAALLFLAAAPAAAQVREDNQLWVGAQAEVDLPRRFRLAVEQQLRVGEAAGFHQTFTDLELSHRSSKHFRFGVHYRLIFLDAETRHRVAGDAVARYRWKPLELSYRLRVQATTREGDDPLVPIRNRLVIAFDAPYRLEPFVGLEIFTLFHPQVEHRERRLMAGLRWRARPELELEAFYLHQRESGVAQPDWNHVLGFGATWRFRGFTEEPAEETEPL